MSEDGIERVARKLCEVRGQNPDELIGHGAKADPSGFTSAIWLHSPRWSLVADEVRARLEMDEALRAAGQEKGNE